MHPLFGGDKTRTRREAVRSIEMLALEILEKCAVNFVSLHWSKAEFKLLKHVNELLPIDLLDRRHAIA